MHNAAFKNKTKMMFLYQSFILIISDSHSAAGFQEFCAKPVNDINRLFEGGGQREKGGG